MKFLGFRERGVDPCIFIQQNGKKKLEIIAVYVDDLILIAETLEEIQHMKTVSLKYLNDRHGRDLILSWSEF